MSFSSNMKDELCRLPLGKNCCMLSELTALYRTSGSLSFRGLGRVQVQFRVENAALARSIQRKSRCSKRPPAWNPEYIASRDHGQTQTPCDCGSRWDRTGLQ